VVCQCEQQEWAGLKPAPTRAAKENPQLAE